MNVNQKVIQMPVAPRYAIDTCATLVEFSAPMWTARKMDRGVTDEVITDKSAKSRDAGRFNKHLLAGRPELEVIQKHVNAARGYYYDHTIPWSDRGLRLLPTQGFAEFDERMSDMEDEYVRLVEEFVAVYPTLITAQAMALGDMFKRDEYPLPDTIRSKFSWSVVYLPVPTAGDFRIDVGNQALADLQARLTTMMDRRVEEAVHNLWDVYREHLVRMAKQLVVEVGPGGIEKRGKVYDSLLDGGLELCGRMKALNLINDPQLDEAQRELMSLLRGVTIDELRKKDEVRHEVRTRVNELLEKFSF